jgi:hypothetical protein
MPSDRTEKQREDRVNGRQRTLELPLPHRDQIAPPLMVDGPEAVRGSDC